MRIITLFTLLLSYTVVHAQKELLPPMLPWKGKSESLIVKKNNPWITPAESSDFNTTPTYQETMDWLKKLCDSSPLLKLVQVGISEEGRDIRMVIASGEQSTTAQALSDSGKPLILAQAGIHAGEIDGKDAGLMLLRDIAHGKKDKLVSNVNLLFIPILNVDGHERSSSYNRVNQRGPSNMGWRTNAKNQNLNRDYSKLDTEGIRAVVSIMNTYNPDFYIDLHVTDGADYQYDITYGYMEKNVKSPAVAAWLRKHFSPAIDQSLKSSGHIPGPLLFAANGMNFDDGNAEWNFGPRFSHSYGDVRHLPSVLVENHSLKPYKQRVLGTYVFLEEVMQLLGKEGNSLKEAVAADKKLRNDVVLTTKRSPEKGSMLFLGVESRMAKSPVTGKEYIEWMGRPLVSEIPIVMANETDKIAKRPKSYWIPSTYPDVINRLALHGITMRKLTADEEVEVTMYRMEEPRFGRRPSEGHLTVTATPVAETHTQVFHSGSVVIDTNQPLGDLAIMLLEPASPDSFFQWGFFLEIFDRTEYAEQYVMEPMARQMLAADPALKKNFEEKMKSDSVFAQNPNAIYRWFYEQSPYSDQRHLLYPVGLQY